ncbi:MAG TPA: class I SAM-dependent methyltransferase [Azoarcus taiwanensis]|uniref:site-specific DNA-methyltransferase (adenine-specific) n=1 Tax=Azoarcus taiwanensis TaxID=666964 RepID=A0A972JA46_9RHOO|nr:class I SAM-dependent methyltransferase [Azoarcus taiwanensis]NMG02693.1 class I SAM-dependent methyltransferase [Azoarcus taiwanensis]HRQ58653.1 class I SAM-dependent methyltransferase [Azoarcus taiwanensis]
MPLRLYDVEALGQVFTPEAVVKAMLALRRNRGRVLEPSCGDGAFLRHLPGATGIELDAAHCPPGALNMDFFAYPDSERFDTIIGNPPYVRFQDIPPATRARLGAAHFDGRSNLYLFFIEKCLRHLAPGGELIFITPRDFLKATSAVRLNRLLFEQGSITDAIELGDARVFEDAVPNCLIWRFEKGRTERSLRYAEIGSGDRVDEALAEPPWQVRSLAECAGHLMFVRGDYPLRLSDIAFVKVGAVSGADDIYADEVHGDRDFVCASTVRTGLTRRMVWCEPGEPPPQVLLPHRARLISRRIRSFDESNWWQWGRGYYQSERPRVYVNGKTRAERPFFTHPCEHYDGAVLAIFPHDLQTDVAALAEALNATDWTELGFVCDGRHLFTQRSLENAPLPVGFQRFLRR